MKIPNPDDVNWGPTNPAYRQNAIMEALFAMPSRPELSPAAPVEPVPVSPLSGFHLYRMEDFK